MKKTAIAPANIAFIKYWGLKNNKLRIPTNGSISMNLSGLQTIVTVEVDGTLSEDEITINGTKNEKQANRLSNHLHFIRKQAKNNSFARVETKSDFPPATGLASSASVFAALSLAATSAYGLLLSEKKLSIVARQGSGSSCRSIPSGFVEWIEGEDSATSYAQSLFPPSWWDIVDIVAIVSTVEKKISSTQGHMCVLTSPFFTARLSHIHSKIHEVKRVIEKKDFLTFGNIIEKEALELQAITITSNPPIIYMRPETIAVIQLVHTLREEGLPVYFTLDAGPNPHILVEKKNEKQVLGLLREFSYIKNLITNNPTVGARLVEGDLF